MKQLLTIVIIAALAFVAGYLWQQRQAVPALPASAPAQNDTITTDTIITDTSANASPTTAVTGQNPTAQRADSYDEQAALDIAEKRVIDVYERSAPAVVSVLVRSTFYSFFSGAYQQEGEGSGFVIDEAGHIITNYHVIRDSDSISVVFADGSSHAATLTGWDAGNDLALLKLETLPANVQPIPLGDATNLRVGQRAIAIGNPFGRFGQTLTTGVISALNRSIEGQREGNVTTTIYDIIQTDAAINRGNSGGPLLNSSGELIGINTAIFSPSGTSTGVGFAVSVETLKRILPDLKRLGYYRNPTLGVEAGYNLDDSIARELNLPSQQGVLLVRLAYNSPLLEQGIQGAQQQQYFRGQLIYLGGDILLSINGEAINSLRQLRDTIVNHYVVGDEVTLRVLHYARSWQEKEVTVTLQEEKR